MKALAEPAPSLFLSKEWLRLGHYTKTLFGHESKILGDKFFLHPEGRSRPDLELEATIQGMNSQEIQCRYLARRDFLIRNQLLPTENVKNCEFADSWLKKLGPSKVSLIFATAYINSAGSSFGHTFLKLSNPKNTGAMELVDYGVNYAARTENTTGALYALKGLFGHFPGNFALMPYHQMIKEYTNLEGRDIWEYELNFTEEEIKRMIFHLLELEQGYFEYYFLDENCSQKLLKLFEIARPSLQLTGDDELYIIPIETVKLLARETDLIVDKKFRNSLLTEWHQRRDQLTVEERVSLHQVLESNAPMQELNTKTLDAGLSYLSWKNDTHKKYEFSKARAARLEKTEFEIQKPEKSPEQGLDASTLSLGFAMVGQAGEGQIRFHPAFHDLLSDDVGASPWSELKVFDFDLRFGLRSYLRKFTLLDFLSTQAIDEFSLPQSWGVDAGAEKNIWLDFDKTAGYLNGRWGLALQPINDLRFLVMLAASAEETYLQRYHLGAGAEFWVIYKNPKIINMKSRLQSLRMSDGELKNHFEFEVAKQVGASQEIRWQYLETKMGNKFEQRIYTDRIAQLAIYFQF